MNTGNYIFDYIYDLVEVKYITKEEAMMFTEYYHDHKRLDDTQEVKEVKERLNELKAEEQEIMKSLLVLEMGLK